MWNYNSQPPWSFHKQNISIYFSQLTIFSNNLSDPHMSHMWLIAIHMWITMSHTWLTKSQTWLTMIHTWLIYKSLSTENLLIWATRGSQRATHGSQRATCGSLSWATCGSLWAMCGSLWARCGFRNWRATCGSQRAVCGSGFFLQCSIKVKHFLLVFSKWLHGFMLLISLKPLQFKRIHPWKFELIWCRGGGAM